MHRIIKVYDNDKGLNTGNGSIFAQVGYTPEVEQYCIENIFKPTIQAMAKGL